MQLKIKYWLVTVGLACLVLAAIAGLGAHLVTSLPQTAQTAFVQVLRNNLGWILAGFFFGCIAFLLLLNDIFHSYILPLDRLTEETTLIATVNPGHRIAPQGCQEFKRLSRCINDAAERLQGLQQTLGDQLQKVTSELERERSILAAAIADLPQGIIGANAAGTILLYNEQARNLFPCSEAECPEGFVCGYLGLGRSVYSLLEPGMLDYGLKACAAHDQQTGRRGVSFISRGSQDRLLRVSMVPIPSDGDGLAGFILALEDISQQIHQERNAMDLLDWFMDEAQANVSGVCSTIDGFLRQERQVTEKGLKRYRSMICDTVHSLSADLEQGMDELSQILGPNWPVHRIRMQDLLQLIQNEARIVARIEVYLRPSVVEDILEGELFTLVQTVVVVLRLLQQEHDVSNLTCSGGKQGDKAEIELTWRGEPVSANVLTAWKLHPVVGNEQDPVLRIRDVFKRHQANWSSDQDYAGLANLCISLPARALPDQSPDSRPAEETGRPMYDFGLLTRVAADQGGEEERLADLIYTVFDLETTGLDVRSGDEIVSIAGVRVVNGRIVAHEVFNQLVNPARPVPLEAVRVHGLDGEKLHNKPFIQDVLPLFYKFAEGTVLVAHCADFDIGFLRAKEGQTGISFANPVLDTFKLSVLVHPTKKQHDLESIAARLGTGTYARHDALGDAWTTAEILLGLLPLLDKQGIRTLGQAVRASHSSKNAQVKMSSVSVGNNDFR